MLNYNAKLQKLERLSLLEYSWSKRAPFRLLNQSKPLYFYPHLGAQNGARFCLLTFSCNSKQTQRSEPALGISKGLRYY
ncbi:hypothetical protein HZ326_30968 [Fusarium oxysporum f. sp. albedinis]|nr:hypothetical protein HZ326_30968 [Fusarium oxysporum f. sp. albedinis]